MNRHTCSVLVSRCRFYETGVGNAPGYEGAVQFVLDNFSIQRGISDDYTTMSNSDFKTKVLAQAALPLVERDYMFNEPNIYNWPDQQGVPQSTLVDGSFVPPNPPFPFTYNQRQTNPYLAATIPAAPLPAPGPEATFRALGFGPPKSSLD